jgi:protein-tyrosine kinase
MSVIEKAIDKLNRRGAPAEVIAGARERPSAEVTEFGAGPRGLEARRSPPPAGLDSAPSHGSREVQLDAKRLRAQGVLIGEGEGALAEEFRTIKRPLLLNAFGTEGRPLVEKGNLVMVTSALPGEGKTFTAVNLAMSVAMEMDRTVLLVDADVTRPGVARTLGIEAKEGLTDLLASETMDLSEVLLRTNNPRLRVLPGGRQHPRATELLSSERMRQVADQLAHRYPDRMVIFDSPALLSTSAARVLAGLVGQVIVVVEAERTPQQTLQEATAMLGSADTVGLVLNKSRRVFGPEN